MDELDSKYTNTDTYLSLGDMDKINLYLNNISLILQKEDYSSQELETIKLFTNEYILLNDHENELNYYYSTLLSKYRHIVNYILYVIEEKDLTKPQKYILDKLRETEDLKSGKSKGNIRVLKNPNAINLDDEPKEEFSMAGYASIIFILFAIMNFGIIAAINILGH